VFKSGINLYYERINLENLLDVNNANELLTKFEIKLSDPGVIY
jgi:hypothetical protein